MSAVQRETASERRQLVVPRKRWPLFAQSPVLVAYIAVVAGTDLALILHGVRGTRWRADEIAAFASLMVSGGLCVEATRRLEPPSGVVRDLLSAWWLPVALLLPPTYALLAPIPITCMLRLRARPALLHRRIFSCAALGLAGATASVAFHRLVPGASIHDARWLVDDSGLGLVFTVACGIVFALVNTLLVAIAAHTAARGVRWRDVLWDAECVLLDVVELCVGVLVTIACALTPALLVIALPPIILLQRSLLHQQLQTAARTDAKTGLLNAATWQREAEARIGRASRLGTPLAVLIIDIDHFKRVNDSYGHLAGDRVLAEVATSLCCELRDDDLVGRFGGEEFVVQLPGVPSAEARRIAERLRLRIGATALPLDEATIRVTVSIGVAALGEHADRLTELLALADLALYRAKESGRDRVCVSRQDFDPAPTRRCDSPVP